MTEKPARVHFEYPDAQPRIRVRRVVIEQASVWFGVRNEIIRWQVTVDGKDVGMFFGWFEAITWARVILAARTRTAITLRFTEATS